jgi:arginyl-tRNA synthetase
LLRSFLTDRIRDAVSRLIAQGDLPEAAREVPIEISDTKSPEHGDFACNFALVAAKPLGMNPRQVGEKLQNALLHPPAPSSFTNQNEEGELFTSVEVAGPGFLNLKLEPTFVAAYVARILEAGSELPKSRIPDPKSINVEFVSVNPNGPITVGSARGAAYGDALCKVLEAAGHQPYREYYVNDGVNSEQMRQFGESVRAHALGQELPEKAYRGEYVQDVAKQIQASINDTADDVAWWQKMSQELMIERQRGDLELFGVRFDKWFSEQTLHDSQAVERALKKLEEQGNAYYADKPSTGEEDPEDELERKESEFPNLQSTSDSPEAGKALWLRSSAFGDDKDRVLVRGDGRPAYIAGDVAYLESKLGDRGFDKAIMVLGPDHHGYIARMEAVCQALGYEKERLEIIIFQIVRFVKDGKPAPMRKRDGNIYELRDLINEVGAAAAPSASKEEQQRIGADVARFFYLMRSHETHMDFDIDLATKQSDENPVFYAQYAHARICSVIRKAEEAGFSVEQGDIAPPLTPSSFTNQNEEGALRLLTHPRETALIKKILDLPWEVQRCAEDYGVHRLTTYAQELARIYHLFYDACRVIQPNEPELTKARLALCEAARQGLKSTFDLLGISAPERMERDTPEPAMS